MEIACNFCNRNNIVKSVIAQNNNFISWYPCKSRRMTFTVIGLASFNPSPSQKHDTGHEGFWVLGTEQT